MKNNMKLVGLLAFIVLLSAFYSLSLLQDWQHVSQWLLQASLLWCFVWQQTWKRLELNRINMNAPLFNNLGWANRITLLRGGLIALTGGFLFQPQPPGWLGWIPALLYGLAAILDRVDGLVARKSKRTTLLGAELDMVFDALGLIVAPLVAVGYGKIHWSYLLLSIAYYVFQGFLNIRRKRGLTIYPLHSSMLRRALAGFQMGFVALVLCPIFSAQVTVLSGFAFMLPVLAGFVVDWLVMTGRIQPSFNKLIRVSNLFLLPALRVILVFCAYLLAADSVLISSTQNTNSFFIYGIFSGAILVLFGLGGRIGALLVLLLISWHQVNNPLSILEVLFIWTSAWVLLLGTGSFNLWRGDHAWVNRHDGV